MMNGEEMQRKMVNYEEKIREYERKMVRYERIIGRLQDDVFNRDNEIRRAKFTVLEALPELNTPEKDPLVDKVRAPGYLDPNMFDRACLNKAACDDREEEAKRKDRAIVEAEGLYNEWRRKISDGVWQLYIEGQYQAGEEGDDEDEGLGQVEVPDVLELKDKYGEELYNAVKIAWFEAKECRRTGVLLKPWDYEAGREQTLTDLLDRLYWRINYFTNNH